MSITIQSCLLNLLYMNKMHHLSDHVVQRCADDYECEFNVFSSIGARRGKGQELMTPLLKNEIK